MCKSTAVNTCQQFVSLRLVIVPLYGTLAGHISNAIETIMHPLNLLCAKHDQNSKILAECLTLDRVLSRNSQHEQLDEEAKE